MAAWILASFLFECLWTVTESKSINVTIRSLLNKGFIIEKSNLFSFRTQQTIPSRQDIFVIDQV